MGQKPFKQLPSPLRLIDGADMKNVVGRYIRSRKKICSIPGTEIQYPDVPIHIYSSDGRTQTFMTSTSPDFMTQGKHLAGLKQINSSPDQKIPSLVQAERISLEIDY